MFQCRWPTQTYIQKAFKNIVFFTVLLHSFYNVFRQKHRNLHVFRHTVGPKHCFLQCFQCSGIQTPFKISLFTSIYGVFFIFVRFSTAGSLPKWPKIPFQYPLQLRHPKIVEKSRKHHLILVSVRNRFCPPSPAKADVATAILQMWLSISCGCLHPNKHAFTAKAAWADLLRSVLVPALGPFCCHILSRELTLYHRCLAPSSAKKSSLDANESRHHWGIGSLLRASESKHNKLVVWELLCPTWVIGCEAVNLHSCFLEKNRQLLFAISPVF